MTITPEYRPERTTGIDTAAGPALIEAWGSRYRHLTIEIAGLRISILDLENTPSVHISADRAIDMYIGGADVTAPQQTLTGVRHMTVKP